MSLSVVKLSGYASIAASKYPGSVSGNIALSWVTAWRRLLTGVDDDDDDEGEGEGTLVAMMVMIPNTDSSCFATENNSAVID